MSSLEREISVGVRVGFVHERNFSGGGGGDGLESCRLIHYLFLQRFYSVDKICRVERGEIHLSPQSLPHRP